MNTKVYLPFGRTALAVLVCLGVQSCYGQSDDSTPSARPEKSPSRHDPVTAAFAVPYGTALSDEQRSEYQRLKDDKEADLRQAFDALAAATTSAEKVDASREFAAMRHDIRAGIRQILAMPSQDALPLRQQSPGDQGNSPQGYSQQGYGPYGQAAYYGGSYGPNQASYENGYYNPYYAFGYYGPVYGYPIYGVWYPANYWHHHHFGQGSKLANQHVGIAAGKTVVLKAAIKTVAPVSAAVKPVPPAKRTALAAAPVKSIPVAKPAPRPVTALPLQIASHSAKHR